MKPSITRFIDEYLLDRNGADAARRAGYAETGAKQRAYILLRRPDVIRAIADRQVEQRTLVGMGADEIIVRLSRLARSATNENVQLRALGMLMRHLGMFTTARAAPPQVENRPQTNQTRAVHPVAPVTGPLANPPKKPDHPSPAQEPTRAYAAAPEMPTRAYAVTIANRDDRHDDRAPDTPIPPEPSPQPPHEDHTGNPVSVAIPRGNTLGPPRTLQSASDSARGIRLRYAQGQPDFSKTAEHRQVPARPVADDPTMTDHAGGPTATDDPSADHAVANDQQADAAKANPLPFHLMSINDLIVAENLLRPSRFRRRPPADETPDTPRPSATTANDRSSASDLSAPAEILAICG